MSATTEQYNNNDIIVNVFGMTSEEITNLINKQKKKQKTKKSVLLNIIITQ